MEMVEHDYNSEEHNPALLSLPVHLRNTILQFVMGSRTIHINARPQNLRVSICSATENDEQAIQLFKDSRHQQLPHHYQVRHARCWSRNDNNRRLQRSLALLSVCRQLYTEAALLPFSMNEFAFDGSNSHSHDMFLDRLSPLQRRSIRRLNFGPQIFYLQSPFDLLAKLPGLREIVLFLRHDICELLGGDDLSGERRKWLIEQSRGIQCKALLAIHVCISSNESAGNPVCLSKVRIVRWAQVLGEEMGYVRAGFEPGNGQLVLRCRSAAEKPDAECSAALNS